LGGFGSGRLPEGLLLGVAGVFVFWQGMEFVFRSQLAKPLQSVEGYSVTRLRLGAEAGIGLSIGLLGGAVGLILGSLRLPAIIRVLALSPARQ